MSKSHPMERKRRSGDWWIHLVLIIGGLFMVFPFVAQLMMSVMANHEIKSVPPTFWPAEFLWSNYAEVFQTIPFMHQFWTSVLITVLRTVGQLILCSMAGYAFARMKFTAKGILFGIVLSILMIPSQVYLLPQYQLITKMNLLETPWGIVLPGLFSAFGTFLMRQFFIGLPKELGESAKLDGANPFQIFWRVMLPLATPGLSAVAITTVLWSWNDLMWPLIVTTRQESMPLSVGIATFAGRGETDYSVMMAASVMAVIPMLILFIALQRRVIEGLAHTGIK